jgi:hypothetical protein
MFIVWGKKLVYRKVGYVADFCPICRGPKPFMLQRIGSASHVYYISSGEGELVGFQRTCLECGSSFSAKPDTYASISKTNLPLEELLKQTFPNFTEVLQERLKLEEKVKRAPASLTKEERQDLIWSPFVLLSPKVEKRFASTHMDKEIGLSIIAAIALLIAGPFLVKVIMPSQVETALLVCFIVSPLLIVWQVATSGRRFINRQIIPVLSKSLYPLSPNENEIKTVLTELKKLKHKIGKKIKAVDLFTQIQLMRSGQ